MKAQRMSSGVAALGGLILLSGCGTSAGDGDAAEAPSSPSQTSPAAPTSPSSPRLTAAPDKPTGTVLTPPPPGPPVRPGDWDGEVVWKHDMLIVTAFGSSTCRPVPEEAVAADRHTVLLIFGDFPDQAACTDDYGPTRSRVPAPSGDIDLNGDVYAMFSLETSRGQRLPVELVNPVLN